MITFENISVIETDFSLISLTGADCERYLQGRVSQDIADLSSPKASLLLSPQGKLLGMMSINKTNDSFQLLTLGGNANSFIESLLLFKVADDVEAKVIQNSPGIKISTDSGNSDFSWPSLNKNSPDLLLTLDSSATESSKEDYDDLRAYLGLPKFGVDVLENQIASVLPLENFVSFTKGCYAGQEVIEKSQAYGRVNKCLVSISSKEPIEVETEVVGPEKKVGKVTSASAKTFDGKYYGIALIDGKALGEALTINGNPIEAN